MSLEIVKSEKNFLELKFTGDAHTILNIIKKKLLEDKNVVFSGYNKPHPLIDESVLVIRTKTGDPKKVLKNSIDAVVKDLKSLSIKWKKKISGRGYGSSTGKITAFLVTYSS